MSINVIRNNWRRVVRQLNSLGLYVEISPKAFPICIVAGYTRSGTTFLGRLLASILDAKYVHEPLNPDLVEEVNFFHHRESAKVIETNPAYQNGLREVLGPRFKGRVSNGHNFIYRGERVIKIVRGLFYLHLLSDLYPETKFCILIRNPASAIASREKKGFDIPDQSKCLPDIESTLTEKQRFIIENVVSKHEKLALTWCLDNMQALKNLERKNFMLVYYENLLLCPHEQVERILDFIGADVHQKRIKKEISRYSNGASREIERLIRGWEGVFGKKELEEITSIVDAFKLSYLYDLESGLPKVKNPNSAYILAGSQAPYLCQ